MPMRCFGFALTLCLLMLLGPLGPAARGQTPPEDRQRARQLFEQSKTRYQQGQFRDAARLLEQAYALDPAPTLLYNLARALESASDLEGAAQAYRRYLVVAPRARDRAAIKKRIENLETQARERKELVRRLEQRPPVPPPPDTQIVTEKTPPPASLAPSPTPVAPWVIAGIGGAGLATGAILGGLAQGKHDDAELASDQTAVAQLNDDAQNLALGANVAFAVGGVLAATGLGWGLWNLLDADDAPSQVSLIPTMSPRQVGLAGTF